MYTRDIRKLAKNAYDILKSLRKVAKILNVKSHTTISRWLNNPEHKPYTFKNKQPSKSEYIVDILKLTIEANPFITPIEFSTLLEDTCDIKVSSELVRIIIKRLGYTRKKARFYGKPSYSEEVTQAFLEKRELFVKQNKTIISVDEVAFGRRGKQATGYSQKGKKLFVISKQPTMKTRSFACACTNTSWLHLHEVNGSFNSSRFLEFIKAIPLPPNSVLLLDNARIHHGNDIKNYLESKGCEMLFVPPYSPWFNPIELLFSIVKRRYYTTQTIEDSFDNIDRSIFTNMFARSLNVTTPC